MRHFVSILLLVHGVIFGCVAFCLAATNEKIVILGVEKNYNVENNVAFKIKNEFNSKLYYGISIEKKVKGQWVEVVPNILLKHASPKPPFEVLTINANETKKLKWPSKLTPKLYRPSVGLFRLVLIYSTDIAGLAPPAFYTAPKVFSREFEISKGGDK